MTTAEQPPRTADSAIPMFDASADHRELRDALNAALWQVLDDPVCDGTPALVDLEARLGARLGGVKAAGVQSGTAGLFLALRALGIGPGDEVVTVANSDLPTTAVVSHVGARFVLVDVEPDSYNLDPTRLEGAITPQTRAIIPVHMYGQPADMAPIVEIARRHRLAVVEDATLALGATYQGQPAGTIGDVGVFSFATSKVLGGAGSGGLIVTADPALDDKVRRLRGYGLGPALADAPLELRFLGNGRDHEDEGYNLKLDGLQAAVVGVKLGRLDWYLAERRRIAARYTAHFAGTAVSAAVVRPDREHAFRDYVVQVPDRDDVRAGLRGHGIATSTRYGPPVHLQSVYRGLGLGPGSFPVAEAHATRVLGLPIYPGMADADVDRVAETLLDELEARGHRS
jgi:dTDP-3-amino-3,4,6-trideoxy-alpha-D-glucose transaminase